MKYTMEIPKPNLLLSIILFFNGILIFGQSKFIINDSVMEPRVRVIIDNDFGGDPDGLFQLAHHLLSPTVEIKGIIGSIQYGNGFYGHPGNAQYSAEKALELLQIMKLDKEFVVLEGINHPLKDTINSNSNSTATLIIEEALKDSVKPLYIVCGAGLTNLANAYLKEPKIADKLILVWIGGTEYEEIASPPPGANKKWEYNSGIDINACKVIFNQSEIPIWQIPRDAYRQALVSYAELATKVKTVGKTGKYLMDCLDDLLKRSNRSLGEAYVLGDSPLVMLTALQSSWERDPSSSKYLIKNAPKVSEENLFAPNKYGREIRVYYDLDNRLMFEDFFAKLALFENN
ncbi:nucleoside hydrolase [Aegicerativicinus sediminis]|uniref:nucleoside hydrolase n=1 Tax=Aegicerativicinus sediminis TaxID=2893202 RepID=UPI001E2A7AF9|nr:nucleoside hydrolase [Aegicerativicinus sediminis]